MTEYSSSDFSPKSRVGPPRYGGLRNALKLALAMLLITTTARVGATVTGTVSWTFTLPGGDSSFFEPTVALGGTNIYAASYYYLYALNHSGSRVWSTSPTPSPAALGSTLGYTHGALSSPTVGSNGVIYIGTAPYSGGKYHGELLAFNSSDGSTKWTWSQPPLTYGAVFSTPTLGPDGTVYIGTDDDGAAYAISGGVTKWSLTMEDAYAADVDSSPALDERGFLHYLCEHGIGASVSVYTQGSLIANECRWAAVSADLTSTYPLTNHFNSSPAIGFNGNIYVGGAWGLYGVANDPSASTAGGVWVCEPSTTDPVAIQSSPAIGADGVIYTGAANGALYGIQDVDDVATIQWEFFPPWPSPGRVLSSPAVAVDNTVYITMPNPTNNQSVLFAVIDGTAEWSIQLSGQYTSSSPIIGPDGTVYITDSNHVYAVVSTDSENPLPPPAQSAWPMYHHDAQHTGRQPVLETLEVGGAHAVAGDYTGKVWGWGDNFYGQAGVDSLSGTIYTNMHVVDGSTNYLTNCVAVAAGNCGFHSLALKSDGTLYAWGDNANYQLGDGTTTARKYAVPVSGLPSGKYIVGLAATEQLSVALESDGTVVQWGFVQSSGTLGTGTTYTSPTGVPKGLSAITQIACGGYHSLALSASGHVYSWGYNAYGQLGTGNTTSSTIAEEVKANSTTFLGNVVTIGTGEFHSFAVTADGNVWAWGYNASGQLGNGGTTSESYPVQVYTSSGNPLTNVVEITGGVNHSLALDDQGQMWAWGDNSSGELGDGTTTARLTAVPISLPSTEYSRCFSAGYSFSIAFRRGDFSSYFPWGFNGGDYGNGGSGGSYSPTTVLLNVP